MIFLRIARWLGLLLIALLMFGAGAWCALALSFRVGGPDVVGDVAAGMVVVLTLIALAFLTTRRRWLVVGIYAVAFAAFLGWWATILPSNDRDWAADVARTATATVDGDRVVVSNVRNFAWRTDEDFDPVWEQRTYSLAAVTGADLFMLYWAGEAIAHTIVSFGFADGAHLAFSIETRKERGEPYSAIAGFFKQYELAVVAADERDVVRVRSNVRGEDVRLYRLRMSPDQARLLLRAYVAEANDIAARPRFYNTVTANCTTLVYELVQTVHPGLPLDPRILISGYLPDYVYELGGLDTSVPFPNLQYAARIHDRAARADAAADFSAKIREGVPTPR